MIKRVFFVIFLLFFLSHNSFAEESYHCTTEKKIGFEKKTSSNTWEPVLFNDIEEYYVTWTGQKDAVWIVTGKGAKIASSFCKDDFSKLGSLYCSEGTIEFNMNKVTGRFLKSFMIGYFQDGLIDRFPEGKYPPSLTIGSCTVINKSNGKK